MADGNKPKFIFRRIRGRVVPIRVTKDINISPTLKTVGGAASIAAGATAAAYAGGKASNLIKQAAIAEDRARKLSVLVSKTGQMGLFNQVRHMGPQKLLNLSTRLHKARNFTLLAGGIAGGALIAYGAKKFLDENKSLKKNEQLRNFTTVGGGFGAASTIAAFAYRRKIHPLESLKAAINYAKSRNVLKYIIKGI